MKQIPREWFDLSENKRRRGKWDDDDDLNQARKQRRPRRVRQRQAPDFQ